MKDFDSNSAHDCFTRMLDTFYQGLEELDNISIVGETYQNKAFIWNTTNNLNSREYDFGGGCLTGLYGH